MKNILLLAHDDAGQEARFQAALDLTRALDGHLVVLDVILPPVMSGDYFGEAGDVIALQAERGREFGNRSRLQSRLEREDVRWEMREATGEIVDCILRSAGLADIVVVNRKLDDPDAPDMRAIVSDAAITVGKPFVAVGQGSGGFNVAGTALVAWDGSSSAMTALVAAVPLLSLASSVIIFEVEEDSRRPSAEEAAAYLSRHGIHAEIRRVKFRESGKSTVIQHACTEAGAAYCVMGAYGHSRLREILFGGVTRAMLGSAQLPLFIAH